MAVTQAILRKATRPVTVLISEDNLTERLGQTRGVCSINQLQTLHMVSKSSLQLNVHERVYMAGASNRGNVIGPLAMDSLENRDATWSMKVKDKFTLFGRHGPRIPVGGTPDEANVGDELAAMPTKNKPRDKESEEPLLFHAMPSRLFEELLHSVDAVAVIGLAGDGKLALAALERRLPFFGLTFTSEHTKWLTKRLEGQIFKRYQNPNSKLYQPSLTKIFAEGETPAAPAAKAVGASQGRKRASSSAP